MQGALHHRGPEDRGLFVAAAQRCVLAHTRLSILDLSAAGHQPMSSTDGRYQIVFNGEIYNYRELRQELSREQGAWSRKREVRGQRSDFENPTSKDRTQATQDTQSAPTWNSNSDTEVILRAYAKWGRDCVQRLRGMFAFAIWDEQRQELFLARDPFGIKPLYYYQTEHCFLFASEVRALLASGLVPRRLSQDGLASYLQYGSVQDPFTVIDDVRSLLPGHGLVVKCQGDRLEIKEFTFRSRHDNESPFFNRSDPYPFAPGDRPSTRAEAVKLLRAQLEESVRLHMISDVPLGAFLSGGIDSSAIVALMSQVTDKAPKTFSVVFEETDFSEGAHAKAVARRFGTEHHEILLSEQSLLKMLPDALAAMDQPTMDGINTYVIAKAVKEAGITVALSGLGGDELFAGYPSFRRAEQMRTMSLVPHRLRASASNIGRSLLNGSVRNRKFWDMMESDCGPYAAYAVSRQLFAPGEITALRRDSVKGEAFGVNGSPGARSSLLDEQSDVINTVSRYELRGYMANTLLRDTDQMSMAHALEVRVPFIDRKVVNYTLSLPGNWKKSGCRVKPLLVDALSNLLPEAVWRRPKMGFTLPFRRWLDSALEPEVSDVLLDGRKLIRLGLNGHCVSSVWSAFKSHSLTESWSRSWAIYVLVKWCELHKIPSF
jgi:asparagine synthase (glutamine-hydrolysing)